jgi:hypothetical protein
MASYRITGRVIDRTSSTGIDGLRVEIWDRAQLRRAAVASAVTVAKGAFELRFDDSSIPEGRQPEVFFRVYFDTKLLLDTKDQIAWSPRMPERSVDLAVDGSLIPRREDPPVRPIPKITRLKLDEVCNLLVLDPQVVRTLKERNLSLDEVNEATLSRMVGDRIITPVQQKEIQVTVSIAKLNGESLELTKALKSVVKESPVELVGWNRADWSKFLQEKKIPLPEGETDADGYGENLRNAVEQSFPSEYFLSRVAKGDAQKKTAGLLRTIEPLFRNNAAVVPSSVDDRIEYDWNGIGEDDRKAIQGGLAELMPVVNSYRQLGLADLLNQGEIDATEKQRLISRRCTALDAFFRNNPQVHLPIADFSTRDPESRKDNWNWDGIDTADQPYVRKQMAAFQRVFILGRNHETGDLLLKQGFDSAMAITSVTESEFLEKSGLEWDKGSEIYARAVELSAAAAHYYVAIHDVARGPFRDIALNNQDGRIVNDLREIDGYEELFGSLDYCDCEACRSILSPGAYFADLMYFVDKNVSKKLFTGTIATHPLYLKSRRPDLWTLPLTCQNTTAEISYQEVVNHVLESYLTKAVPTSDVYEMLRTADWSCRQPFNLALEEIRLYLSHFDLRLADIFKALKLPRHEQERERLGLSVEELDIVSKPNVAGARKRFGNRSLDNFDVQEFIRLAGIERSDLDELLATNFAPSISHVKANVVDTGADIQQYRELLYGLTADILDVMLRYLRLWKKSGWTIREFDLVLCSLQSAGMLANLEELEDGRYPRLLVLARLVSLHDRFGFSPEELAAIVYRLPVTPVADNRKALYYRIFDLEKIYGTTSVNAATTVTLPANDPGNPLVPLIVGGLGISESELFMLFRLLGIDTSVNQAVGIGLLSNLYRQALIARRLRLGIEDYVNLAELLSGTGVVPQLHEIERYADAVVWMKGSGFTIPELLLVLKGKACSALQFKNDQHTAAAAILDIQTSSVNDKKGTVDLLKSYLQKSFNITVDQLDRDFLQILTPADLGGTAIAKALGATFTNGIPDTPADLDGLVELLRRMERFSLLFSRAELKAGMVSFLVADPAVFGITDFSKLDYDQLVRIVSYCGLLENRDDQRELLHLALQNVRKNNGFRPFEHATLSSAWAQPQSLVESLTASIGFSGCAIDAVEHLQECLSLCVRLGLQGNAFVKLKSSDRQGLLAARNVVVGAFTSKYPDEAPRADKAGPYSDKLNTLKRDALCDYIISRSDIFKFQDRSDLFHFFLLDVEMSSCTRTSWLVAAITSLQLYVHRCLMNLEQSSASINPSIADVSVPPDWIPSDEWEWRKNYRVWEANRKVFLYPENYIEPSLRDTKTELFRELEDELLQQKITAESAEAAYRKYLAQFTELTRVRYVGGYYHHVSNGTGYLDLADGTGASTTYYVNDIETDSESDESCFYLFARTSAHPYQYKYRTYNRHTKAWTSWKSIDLGIEASEISPIIHRGKLYIYWSESQGKEVNRIANGSSTSDGFVFKTYVKYSFLDENGKWSAPQRLYVGQFHMDERTIFNRVWATYPPDDVREKTHDSTVERFQELVVRKPYATLTGDTTAPVGLFHIWTHDRNTASRIQYTTNEVALNLGVLSFSFPACTIEVVNGDFKSASSTVPATLSLLGKSYDGEAVVTLFSSGSGFAAMTFKDPDNGTDLKFAWPVQVGATESQEISTKITESRLSLSSNMVTSPMQTDMLAQAPNVKTVPALFHESYNLSDNPGTRGFYVESGTDSLSQHYVYQKPNGTALLLVSDNNSFSVVRLSTVLADKYGDILFAKGLEQFLTLATQQDVDETTGQQVDFTGAYGEYYWEMFFHIPFLIASHLNANQKFKEARWWYERIFDPTANPKGEKTTERNWQFREFRNLDIQKLKDILSDSKAIDAYKKDPFNPHAIARLRLSAYQKTTVMHYIDNLVDWGDYLFTQDTRESINEAEMLYQLAYDILGRRPKKVGKCKTVDESTVTYAKLEPQMSKGAEFLIVLENYHLVKTSGDAAEKELTQATKALQALLGENRSTGSLSFAEIGQKLRDSSYKETMAKNRRKPASREPATKAPYASRVKTYKTVVAGKQGARENLKRWKDAGRFVFGKEGKGRFRKPAHPRMPGYEVVKQIGMAFCVPPNADLMQYWDRVEDRLFKIRNCMNIRGVRRSLSLFQPPIDPMMLVRARAAGLSLEDIVALASGAKQPAYRFTYLVEKAKQYTQTLQAFGGALLSALEKKDAEELTLLRTVHEKNILSLTKVVKRKQLQEAQQQYQAAEASMTNVQNRVDYYQGLIDTGLIPWEVTEQISKNTASGIRITEATLGLLSSVFGFLPQLGSPFAMKYGGQELKNGTGRLADAMGTLAVIADNIAILAGLEASHQRREQEWKQQLRMAQQELKQSGIQLIAADIRQQIVEQDLLIHEKSMDQADNVYEFYKNKFTGLALYNYLASTLNRLYRNAYNVAYALAKQAEAAYGFERQDSEIYIQGDNWQFDRAGLLSGERLMLQLQELEKKYIDGNVRQPEITQTFSLAMLRPKQLLELRQNGTCEIDIPELAFDMLYPGHYFRRIKSVRLTIPCVAGPYTNISARLTLLSSRIALEDDPGSLTGVNTATTTTIWSSSANNDAGVFDFNFHDERYLPFEGAGAVSTWRLNLPKTMRAFSYDTIADVLLHISYTAREGDAEAAENRLANLFNAYVNDYGLFRLVSLRHEFPDALNRLFSQPLQSTTFELTPAHFPYLLASRELTLVKPAEVYLKPKGNAVAAVTGTMKLNGANSVAWTPTGQGSAVTGRYKNGTVDLIGTPFRTWTIEAGENGLDKEAIDDILILVRYSAS